MDNIFQSLIWHRGQVQQYMKQASKQSRKARGQKTGQHFVAFKLRQNVMLCRSTYTTTAMDFVAHKKIQTPASFEHNTSREEIHHVVQQNNHKQNSLQKPMHHTST